MERIKQHTADLLLRRITTATTSSSLAASLSEIRLLAKHDPQIRLHLAQSNLIPVLSRLLLLPPLPPNSDLLADDVLIQENATATLLNISISTPESLMSTPTLLPALSAALRLPSHAVKQHAAATLFSLLSVDAYRPIIGSKSDILTALIDILKNPNLAPTRSIKDCLKALYGISLYPLNRAPMIDLNVIPVLFMIIRKEERVGVLEDASAVMAQVAGCCESLKEIVKVDGVRAMVEMVGQGGRVGENAVSGLLGMVMSGGDKAVEEVREVDGVEEVVRRLVEGGSDRGRRKGVELLKVLETGRRRRMSWNDESDRCYSSSVGSNGSF